MSLNSGGGRWRRLSSGSSIEFARAAACVFFVPLLALGACDTSPWLGGREAPPLPGERISILSLQRQLEPDPRIQDLQVRLPRPYRNDAWPQRSGYAGHAMHHLKLADNLVEVWRARVGEGSGRVQRLTAPPVVAAGRLFVFDAEAGVAAFDAATGRRLWRINLTPEHEDEGTIGGGVAYDEGRLFVTTGYGEVVAVDPETGGVSWRYQVSAPIRAAPTVAAGRVFAVSFDNQLHVLAAEDGRLLWSHVGIAEPAALLGAASPAVEGEIVIVPYSSGEIFALRVENGRVAWFDSLSAARASTSTLASLSDINGEPVIDRGRVLVISHSGRMVALDLRSGRQFWDQTLGGVQTPWVAGDFIYVVTTEGTLLCLSREDGRIRWVTELPRFVDEEAREEPITWAGPVLVSDRLVLASSHGFALAISPYTGRVLGRMGLPDPAAAAPIVANETLYFLTDEAEVVALR